MYVLRRAIARVDLGTLSRKLIGINQQGVDSAIISCRDCVPAVTVIGDGLMAALFEPGHQVDDFVIDACIHTGGMARIYSVHYADPAQRSDFPLVMKVPRMTAADGAENLVGFEVERQILAAARGPHVPRLVAAGDIALPYLVMEYVRGATLQDWLDAHPRRDAVEIARIGALVASAVHSLHEHEVCHLDLKPANVLMREGGSAVLLDFGLSWHARTLDLLADGQHVTVGSYPWIAPEQVVGLRGDPRSDLFAIGVILYEMCTGELPFGNPQTRGGLRQRFWMLPRPPRQINADVPDWLQEIILRCLEPKAEKRHASAALLAFDLSQPDQVKVTQRGRATRGIGFSRQCLRWMRRRAIYQPSPMPARNASQMPIVMVAVPHHDATEATLQALRQAVRRGLGNRPGARLACMTVVSPGAAAAGDENRPTAVELHQQMLAFLREWAGKIDLGDHVVSYHVLESGDVAQALLAFAEANHVNLIIMGAATHGLQLQRFVATVPIKVAMHAPCTVMLVKS
jgi:nucleotide-binding universal stress UspA family protein